MNDQEFANELNLMEKHKLMAAVITLTHFLDLEPEYILSLMSKSEN